MSDHLLRNLSDGSPLVRWSGRGDWLDNVLSEAGARWPTVTFASDATLAAFARALDSRSVEALERLHAPDLLLASACAAGDPAAISRLDAQLAVEVSRAVRPADAFGVDEVAQLVRERILVGSPGKIAEYSGDGPLGAWLRAVAVRVALNARRVGGREDPVSSPPEQPLVDPDPELALLRARHRADFREAFASAIAALTPRERTVLRLSTLDGLTLAHIGAMYRKDASTVCRWLEQIRATLLSGTRAALATRLGASGQELDSMMRVADSELTVSLARLLSSAGA